MDSGRFYIGTDLKFQITINATGFDQSKDKYNIDLYCGDRKLSFTQDDVIKSRDNYYLVVSTISNIAADHTIVVSLAQTMNVRVKQGGSWVTPKKVLVKQSGTWQEASKILAKSNGTWK